MGDFNQAPPSNTNQHTGSAGFNASAIPSALGTSISSDAELSLSLSVEFENIRNNLIDDELPAFEIRLISPSCRTPSPITFDEEDFNTPTNKPLYDDEHTPNPLNNADFVTVEELNEKINPLGENNNICNDKNLETIFEDVFLSTPPRQHSKQDIYAKMEKMVISRRTLLNRDNNFPKQDPI